MKIYLDPLLEKDTPFLTSYLNPAYYFEAEWCLDMYGYLDRDEIKERIDQINKIVEQNPLLSEKTKKVILAIFGAITALIVIVILATISSSLYDTYPVYIVIQAINFLGLFLGNYLIDKEAKRRVEKFSTAIKPLFDEYNERDNPTANWKLKWRKVLTHHKVQMTFFANNDGSVGSRGKITPVFAEQAEIELEINDALSDITECTVRLNLHKLGKLRRNRIQNLELEKILSETKDEIATTLEKPTVPSKDAENMV